MPYTVYCIGGSNPPLSAFSALAHPRQSDTVPCKCGRALCKVRCPTTVGTVEFQSLLVDLLAGNRGPGFGIEVTAVGAGLSHVNVTLTFVAGRRGC